ncbi:protoheme IX farnesyltransferase 2 [Lentibacillus kapialis]|uniref:Protoheme IX farnesyltransferase n=1 Tax=Lentibacillus kapialis TaxID=340214 RepID=A0A917PQB0_9BACI|nr:heme o synthase [Lentibacillus kapialis]GGJ86987.1 protoheme IX farnesyltransferase 2 [Lentibacillus kapialis]
MDKVETTSSQIIDNSADTKRKIVTFLADFKSLTKMGIVNSNLMITFAGFWLAIYFTNASFIANWDVFLLTMAGSALVIAGGCMMNNWYDVDIDPVMTRTKGRPTVTGSVSLSHVLVIAVSSTALGLILLMFTTMEAALIAFFGWFVYVVLYTMWSKRKYTLNTAIGSFSGAVPPLIGWAAVDPGLHTVAFVLFLVMFIWQTPHFLALAIKKNKEYKDAGVPMLPAVYGFEITKRQIVVYIVCLLPLPFFMASLGNAFIVMATLLNAGWLAIGISGFFMKNDLKWANMIFIYSLNYLTLLFVMMVVVTSELPFS